MPTNPPPDLLDRDLTVARIREALDVGIPMLEEIVNQGLAVCARCLRSGEGGDEHLPIILGLRHLVEVGDGVTELVKAGAFVAARPLLRTEFEALLQLEYILKDQTTDRAFDYLVADIRRRISIYNKLDPASDAGKELRTQLDTDNWAGTFELPEVSDLPERQANLEDLLQKPKWKEADARFSLAQEETRRRWPRWFSLSGGPRNLRELATTLGRGGQYEILYIAWSATTHAQDFLRPLTKSKKGAPAIIGVRNPSTMSETINLCAVMMVDAMKGVLKFYRPDEERSFAAWYKREVSGSLLELGRVYARLGIGRTTEPQADV